MDPGRYDITVYQGATFALDVQYRDSNGTPVNMSGYGLEAELWNRTGTAKLGDFSLPWTAQASGSFRMILDSEVTATVNEQGQYDLLITEPDGEKYYLLQGTAFLARGLTGR